MPDGRPCYMSGCDGGAIAWGQERGKATWFASRSFGDHTTSVHGLLPQEASRVALRLQPTAVRLALAQPWEASARNA
jgi:hypothetical protein